MEGLLVSFDAFISYASKDKIVADAVCARLEAAGIRCWIAPRDIVAGTSYGEAIIDAIHGAKVMVLVFSSSANASGHIPKEVERAVSSGVAILPFRIEDVAPGKSLDYFIGSVHWLDAMTPPMEKHLDNLAATVHKLIPAKGSELTPGASSAGSLDGTVMWQRGVAAAAGAATTAGAVTAAGAGTGGGGLAGKKIWIGVAAVVVLLTLVVMYSHSGGGSGGNSAAGGDTPAVTNPGGDGNATSDPNAGGGNTVTPATKKPARQSSSANSNLSANVDLIVGCYQWFNNSPVTIHADGTVTGGAFTARWRLVDAQRRAYTLTWPVMVETLPVSADQRTTSGGNQYGYPISGGRVTGSVGLVRTWHWANGWNVDVQPNGTFTSGTFRGTWRAADASRGLYEMNWPSPTDSVVLLGGGTRIAGANQYGVATGGVKTGACGGN